MLKKYIGVIFTLLLTFQLNAQIYIEGYGGVNTLTLPKAYNFTGNIGFGYNNRKIKIGIEAGLGTGIGYKYSEDPSGGIGGVSFSDYVEGETYNSTSTPKKSISNSGNIYPTITNKMIFANQFSFGLSTEWFIINSFTNKSPLFDIGLISGIGFSHHHVSDTSIYQPYVKAGLELNFNIKNVTFLLNGDIRYFVALNGVDNQTNAYHSYIQQTINVGVRYTIPVVHNRVRGEDRGNNLSSACVYNYYITKQDTTVISKVVPLPTTILFANNRYDIRDIEIRKLESAIKYIKDYNLNVEIIGMASNIGKHDYNEILSQKRCQSVQNYLISHGVGAEKIKINALGDSRSEIIEEDLDRCVLIVFE